jgi:3-methyladenine DNA glycosylase Tag
MMAKSASKVFKSIRFAKLDPDHQKAGPFSTDDEEHYTVSTQEYEQQVKHVKKRAMQEDKGACWDNYKRVPGKKPYSPGSCVKESSTEEVNEDLRKWFSKTDPEGGWKRINSEGEAIGPCAREPGEPKPKCMSNEKRASLTKKERASAVRAKRKHDPNPERKGEPINVSNFGKGKISEDMEYLNEKNVPTSPEKWAQAKAQAKSKFDVYPSAYANGWAAKKYKEMGGGWKSVSEAKEKTEYDYEGDMARGQLQSIINNAQRVHDMLEDNDNLPEWVQSKITLAEDYISTVANYMMSEIDESVKEVGDDPTGSIAQETLVKKGGKTTVSKPIAEASSVAVRMQKALDRIKQKREASEQRAKELLQPKKPEPVKEEAEQLDELSPNTLGNYMKAGHKKYDSIRNNTDSASMAKKSKLESGIKKAAAKRYPVKPSTPEPKRDPNSRGYEQGRYMGDSVEHDESLIEGLMSDTGWQKSKSKTDTVVDKSGAVHTAQSKVRDLARRAMKDAGAKQAKSVGAKPMKESTLTESRKTEIIKDAAKKKKAVPDKFEANPTLDSQVQKVDNT